MGGFKDFLLRGNLIQLATAVIMGVAFGNLVNAFTEGLISPILGIFGAVPSFKHHSFTINGSHFTYGKFIDALIAFLITATVLYYAVVFPWNYFTHKEVESAMRDCPDCASSISKKATRCPHCTSSILAIPPDEPKPIEEKPEKPESPAKIQPEPV